MLKIMLIPAEAIILTKKRSIFYIICVYLKTAQKQYLNFLKNLFRPARNENPDS
jgi:hypothetical protein